MTDYNDGEWHGWNGGECPVDPETLVHAVEQDGTIWRSRAMANHWPSFRGAFRVTKPAPAKPREWWAVGLHLHNDEAAARTFLDELNDAHPEMDFGPIIHVREVLPD